MACAINKWHCFIRIMELFTIGYLGPWPPPTTSDRVPFGLLATLYLFVLGFVILGGVVLRQRQSLSRAIHLAALGSFIGIILVTLPFLIYMAENLSLKTGWPSWWPGWWPSFWPFSESPSAIAFGGTWGIIAGYYLNSIKSRRDRVPVVSNKGKTIRIDNPDPPSASH